MNRGALMHIHGISGASIGGFCRFPPRTPEPTSLLIPRGVPAPGRCRRAPTHRWERHASGVESGVMQTPSVQAPNGTTPDPVYIMQTGMAFMQSRVLHTAVRLGLFSVLGDGSMTAEELGKALQLHPRSIYDFFDTLVAMKLLDRTGDGPEGRYRNTAATAAFLVKGRPQYKGGMLEMCSTHFYGSWGELESVLRTGETNYAAKGMEDETLYDVLRSADSKEAFFLDALADMHAAIFTKFANLFDFQGYQIVSDVGCGPALLTKMIAQRHRHLTLNAFDLPSVTCHAQNCIDAAGLTNRIAVCPGDFFVDDLPKADVVVMAFILHNWSLEERKMLIRKAHIALPEDGVFVAIDYIIDPARRENIDGLIMSLTMRMELKDGFEYTAAEFQALCGEAGFRRFDTIPLGPAVSAAVAYK